jgi:hypothetical protein
VCFKRVAVKVFAPGNKQWKTIVQRAAAGKAFTPQGLEEILMHIAGKVEQAYPEQEYRLVEIGSAAFNFVHVGVRSIEESA